MVHVFSRISAYWLRQNNIALHFFLHSMPELRSFLWYRRILRILETISKQYIEDQIYKALIPVVVKLLLNVPSVKKFPLLGIQRVHFWIFCVLQKMFSIVIETKDFVQEIICIAEQPVTTSFIPLKMKYNPDCLKSVFRDYYLTLFITNINSKNEKYNGIGRNNYCPSKKALINY